MNIFIKFLNESGSIKLEFSCKMDAPALIAMSSSRVAAFKLHGREYAEGSIPFFAKELISASEGKNASDDEVYRQAANIVMTAWLTDSIYDGVTEEQFINSNLSFVYSSDGAVKYDRIPITSDAKH